MNNLRYRQVVQWRVHQVTNTKRAKSNREKKKAQLQQQQRKRVHKGLAAK